jgi:hypothetical protein
MTRSNRMLNRVILFVLGLVAIVAAVVAGAGVLPAVRSAVGLDLPATVELGTAALWAIAGVSAIVLVLCVLWIGSRGRGGTAIAVRESAGADQVTVNVGLVRDVIAGALEGERDVLGTHVDLYRVRRTRAARIRVAVRRGGDAVAVVAAVEGALGTLDRVLGRELPAVVHLTGGTRSALARSTRVR